jgi:hypothetical protein
MAMISAEIDHHIQRFEWQIPVGDGKSSSIGPSIRRKTIDPIINASKAR